MHPELCAADTTFGTEKNKKELFTLTFKNGNNNIMNGGRAYIPNAQRWVFGMMFSELLPFFWGPEVCERLRLVITDGCCDEYLSVIQNLGDNKPFPNAVAGLCYFHLVLQGWDRIVYPNLPKEGKQYNINNVILPRVKEYIKTWYLDVENEQEYKLSKEIFYPWLSSLEQDGLRNETHLHIK